MVAPVVTGITDNWREIHARVAVAAARSGRDPAAITVVAVSKGHAATAIQGGLAAGLRHFGENYLQEALPKVTSFRRDAIWHFIGRLQSNKAREIATQFDWVQTVTSVRHADRLAASRAPHGPPLQVCIQVAPSAGTNRQGCPAGDLAGLAAQVACLPRLALRGLMFLPLADLGADELRVEFRRVRQLFDALRDGGHGLDTLSMGMSGDYVAAIEEGSTMIRLGTALFGPRA